MAFCNLGLYYQYESVITYKIYGNANVDCCIILCFLLDNTCLTLYEFDKSFTMSRLKFLLPMCYHEGLVFKIKFTFCLTTILWRYWLSVKTQINELLSKDLTNDADFKQFIVKMININGVEDKVKYLDSDIAWKQSIPLVGCWCWCRIWKLSEENQITWTQRI